MEIREEAATEPGDEGHEYAKPFGLWVDGVRWTWHDTAGEALTEARALLEMARDDRTKLQDLLDEKRAEITAMKEDIQKMLYTVVEHQG